MAHAVGRHAATSIDREVAKYPPDQKQSAVMACLAIAQDETRLAVRRRRWSCVADYLGMPPIAVYEVATFYTMYNLQPVGQLQAQRLHQPAVRAARRRGRWPST